MTRREFLATGGALVVTFALFPAAGGAQRLSRNEKLPGSLDDTPLLDSWIRIDADDAIVVFTGKVELGQGIKTALIQVAAEELVVEPRAIRLVTADTSRTPDESYTSGSQSMPDSATAILNAAAQVREILVDLAARRFGVAADGLIVDKGSIRAADGRSASYGDLIRGRDLHLRAGPRSKLRDASKRTVMGTSMQRVDIPGKVSGITTYVQDLRLPDMVHARVVRPPSYGARLRAVDIGRTSKLPGVLKIARDGSHLAVIAEHEYQAVVAARALAVAAAWEERHALPRQSDIYAVLKQLPSQDYVIVDGAVLRDGPGVFVADFMRPYQVHGSIGPSCAVGLYRDNALTVWTHSQGVYPLQRAIAEMLHLPLERVRCIHMDGSGCYGHNGADDAGADAALLAVGFPGRPVRVQWMRDDEHGWEPYGPAMISNARARLDAKGNVADWQYEVWSNSHNERPGPAGNLAPALNLETPFVQPAPTPIPQPTGGGDRNAIPLYKFGNVRVVHHFIPSMPLRVSSLRALGAYMNIFSVESFVDELAHSAAADPVEFRLRHLDDPRARAVITMASERFGWKDYKAQPGRGKGFAFARYKNLAAYAAIACEVEVDRDSGRVRMVRAVAATDSGEAVNPDGIRNQVEGSILQSMSWTLYEAVTFDTMRVTSKDWSTYPILRFPNLPDSVEVHVINRPGLPFLGTGEAAQGPTAAAIANAIARVTGTRLRELPLTPSRVKAVFKT